MKMKMNIISKLLLLVVFLLLIACGKKPLTNPRASIESGTYPNSISIELDQEQLDKGANIYYTINGEAPNTNFYQKGKKKYKSGDKIVLPYKEGIEKYILQIIATGGKKQKPSEVITYEYVILPTFSKPTFNYDDKLVSSVPMNVKIFFENWEKGKSEIRYTIDGSTPTESSYLYDSFNEVNSPFSSEKVITFNKDGYVKLKAKVFSKDKDKILDSEVGELEFQVAMSTTADPSLFTSNEAFTVEQNPVAIETTNENITPVYSNRNVVADTNVFEVNKPTTFEPVPIKQEPVFEPIKKLFEKSYSESIVSTAHLNKAFYVLTNVNNKAILTKINDSIKEESSIAFDEEPSQLKVINNTLYLLTTKNNDTKSILYRIDSKKMERIKIQEFSYKIYDFTYYNKELIIVVENAKQYFLVNATKPNIFKELNINYSLDIPFVLLPHKEFLYLLSEKDNSKGITSLNLMKFDKNFNVVLSKLYGGGNREFLKEAFIRNDQIILVGATSSYKSSTNSNFSNILLSIDLQGNLVKTNSFGEEEVGVNLVFNNDSLFLLSNSINSTKFYTLDNSFALKTASNIAEKGKGNKIFIIGDYIYSFITAKNSKSQNSMLIIKDKVK